jgi:hypothetical protein
MLFDFSDSSGSDNGADDTYGGGGGGGGASFSGDQRYIQQPQHNQRSHPHQHQRVGCPPDNNNTTNSTNSTNSTTNNQSEVDSPVRAAPQALAAAAAASPAISPASAASTGESVVDHVLAALRAQLGFASAQLNDAEAANAALEAEMSGLSGVTMDDSSYALGDGSMQFDGLSFLSGMDLGGVLEGV